MIRMTMDRVYAGVHLTVYQSLNQGRLQGGE